MLAKEFGLLYLEPFKPMKNFVYFLRGYKIVYIDRMYLNTGNI